MMSKSDRVDGIGWSACKMPSSRSEPVRTDCRHMVCAAADQACYFHPPSMSLATIKSPSTATDSDPSSSPNHDKVCRLPLPDLFLSSFQFLAYSPFPLWHSQKQLHSSWNARSHRPCFPIFSCSHVISRAPSQTWAFFRPQTFSPPPSSLSYSIRSSCFFSWRLCPPQP